MVSHVVVAFISLIHVGSGSVSLFNLSKKRKAFKNFQVNEKLMKVAKKDAIFMHDLPAQRGEEVSAGVIDGKQSVVWQQAENRLHCQKGIIEWCLKGK